MITTNNALLPAGTYTYANEKTLSRLNSGLIAKGFADENTAITKIVISQANNDGTVPIAIYSGDSIIYSKPVDVNWFNYVGEGNLIRVETTEDLIAEATVKTSFNLANYLKRPNPLEDITFKEFEPSCPVKVGDLVVDTEVNKEGQIEYMDFHPNGAIDTVWIKIKNHQPGVDRTFMYYRRGNYKLDLVATPDGKLIDWPK